MGRIDRLELENFKTYRGRHVVGPLANFTCIIGPNGSGKSNIMDAISFVLGIRAGALRGKELRDLIFRAKGEPSSGRRRASVRLVYTVADDEVEGMAAGDELVFGRTIAPSGTSSYRVNDRAVPRSEYDKVLASIGVVARGTNCLVAQGTVASLGTKTPQDMLHLFEEVSGSADLIEEYEEKKQALAEAQENTITTYQRKKEVIAERREARSQKEEADKFNRKLTEKADLTREYYLWQLFHIDQRLAKHDARKAELESELRRLVKQEDSLHAELDERVGEYRKAAKAMGAAQKEKDRAGRAERKAREEAAQANEELKDCVAGIAQWKTKTQKATTKVEKQQREVEALEGKVEAVEEELEGLEEGKGHDGEDGEVLEEYLELKKQATTSTARATEAFDKVDSLQKQDTSHLHALEEQWKDLQATIDEKEASIAEMKTQQTMAHRRIATSTKELQEVKAKLAALVADEEADREQHARVREELEAVQKRLRTAKDARQRTEREEKQIQALSEMKMRFTGVRGRLVDLCRPTSKKYELAVTRVLGKLAEAIVVDTAKTGWQCINYLRKEKLGTADILPLDGLRVKDLPSALRSLGGAYKLAVDVIQCDRAVKTAVHYACGDAVVCTDMDSARTLRFGRSARRVKAVTLQGAVIAKSGNMTGGNSRLDKPGSSHWQQQDLEADRAKKAALIKEEQQLNRTLRYSGQGSRAHQIKEARNTVDRLGKGLDSVRGHIAVMERDIVKDTKNVAASRKELAKLEAPIAKCKQSLAAREDKLAECKRELDRVEMDVYGDFCERLGIDNIGLYVDGNMQRAQELRDARMAKQAELNKLKAQLDYVRSNTSAAQKLAKNKKRLKAEERQHAALKKKLKAAQTKEKAAREAAAKLTGKVEAAQLAHKTAETEVRNTRKEKASVLKLRHAAEKAVTEEEMVVEKARAARHDFVSRARDEEVTFPMKDGELRVLAAEKQEEDDDDVADSQSDSQASARTSQRTARFSQSNASAVRRDRRRVDQVDFSQLKRGRTIENELEFDGMKTDYEKRLRQLATELSVMQPNMKAVERFKDVQARFAEADAALSAAKAQSRKAGEEFDAVKDERTKLFMDAFTSVAECIDGVYKAMTMSEKHTQGGQAYLALTNDTDPFDGGVRYTTMPPTKAFRELADMSGGEKAIACLSLLFAIHAHKRAPFFILDEIDGNLDKMNVAKVVNYISQRTREENPVQCIVISLKAVFFERGDRLVGVCKDMKSSGSRLITLDLSPFAGALVPEALAPTPRRKSTAGAGSGAGAGSARPKSAKKKGGRRKSAGAAAADGEATPATSKGRTPRSRKSSGSRKRKSRDGSPAGKAATPASGRRRSTRA